MALFGGFGQNNSNQQQQQQNTGFGGFGTNNTSTGTYDQGIQMLIGSEVSRYDQLCPDSESFTYRIWSTSKYWIWLQ